MKIYNGIRHKGWWEVEMVLCISVEKFRVFSAGLRNKLHVNFHLPSPLPIYRIMSSSLNVHLTYSNEICKDVFITSHHIKEKFTNSGN